MKRFLQFLFPLAYPLVVVWHIILGSFVAGILAMIFNWEITLMLGIGAAVLAVVVGFAVFVIWREEL